MAKNDELTMMRQMWTRLSALSPGLRGSVLSYLNRKHAELAAGSNPEPVAASAAERSVPLFGVD